MGKWIEPIFCVVGASFFTKDRDRVVFVVIGGFKLDDVPGNVIVVDCIVVTGLVVDVVVVVFIAVDVTVVAFVLTAAFVKVAFIVVAGVVVVIFIVLGVVFGWLKFCVAKVEMFPMSRKSFSSPSPSVAVENMSTFCRFARSPVGSVVEFNASASTFVVFCENCSRFWPIFFVVSS